MTDQPERTFCIECGRRRDTLMRCSCFESKSLTVLELRTAARTFHQHHNKHGLIYLAVPYLDGGIVTPTTLDRVKAVSAVAGSLIKEGFNVFSPISQGHAIAEVCDLPRDNEYWWTYNRNMINCSQMVMVLKMPGWKESKGVAQEMDYAKSVGTPVVLRDHVTGVSTPYRTVFD